MVIQGQQQEFKLKDNKNIDFKGKNERERGQEGESD